MSNEKNQTQVNKVDAQSKVNKIINNVVTERTISNIKAMVKKAYDEMFLADINKEVKMVQSKELAYETSFMGEVNKFRVSISYAHEGSNLSQPIFMVVKISVKRHNGRFSEIDTMTFTSESLAGDTENVLGEVKKAAKWALNWGCQPIQSEWSNIMDLYLQTYRTKRGYTEAQIVAVYNNEVIEGGWITADWDADEEEIITQALMVYWVNSEVVGTGRI